MARNKLVFVDVDTQADFMLPGGRLYVPGAETLLPTIARLTQFAQDGKIPLIASTDAHATDDPEFRQWPAHCVRGTPGQLKIPGSLLDQYLVIPQERQTKLSDEELRRYPEWILEKDTLDMFTNPQADDLVERLDAERYVVYGVATEYCVRLASLGLLQRGKTVLVLTDAIKAIDAAGSARTLQELREAGVELAEMQQALRTAA